MIYDHNRGIYRASWKLSGKNKYNGAYYYSKELIENIIPHIKTDRPWVTINVPSQCEDHAIVFIHNNIDTSVYDWMSKYDDLILICGIESTCDKVAHLGKTIYLPLSIDVKEVKQYKTKKTKDTAYVGRSEKKNSNIPDDVDCIEDLPREDLLKEMAKYKKVYTIGRCALEAKVLGCKLLAYDDRFPDVDFWKVLDNAEAVKILQEKLDEIDNNHLLQNGTIDNV